VSPAAPAVLGASRERPAPPPEPPPSPPRPYEPAAPGIIPGAGAPPARPILGNRAPFGGAPERPKDKPNLLVATMFGLRAFGRGKGAPAGSPPPAHGAPGPGPGRRGGGVLGLGRRASSPASEHAEPRWIGPREGGLPELATRAPDAAAPVAAGAASDLDERLKKLRASDAPRERRSSRPPSSDRPSRADRARSGSRPVFRPE